MNSTSSNSRTTERSIAGAFAVSALAALALAAVYVRGGQPQLEGAFLALSLGALGVGIVMWAKALFPQEEAVGERSPLPSDEEERQAFVDSFKKGEAEFGRRPLLIRMLGGAVAALALAAVFPIRSLGPSPRRTLFRTAWRSGSRLVNDSGRAIRVGELEVGTVITVFPEGHPTADDSATLLIRLAPGELRARPGREDWAPAGYVAYSKICTHVACPVGLYEQQTHRLVCPCHQSTFDVLDGARPVLGPATRSLPQLPLKVDDEGYLAARSDYTEPVGPTFWNRDRG